MKRSRHVRAALVALATSLALVSAGLTSAAGQAQPRATAIVRAVDGAGLRKAIADARGRVVLLNLWATWCGPCVEEFPDLVRLHERYGPRGLVVLAASLDEPQDREKVEDFLRRQKASFPVYIRKGGPPEAWIDRVDRNWSGAVPTTYLFDRQGRRIGKPITGARTFDQFVELVEPVLR